MGLTSCHQGVFQRRRMVRTAFVAAERRTLALTHALNSPVAFSLLLPSDCSLRRPGTATATTDDTDPRTTRPYAEGCFATC